jgi:D-alanine--poly(phosphoribitol) ligase subunit 2
MSSTSPLPTIQAWLEKQFMVDFSSEISPDQDLFEAGVIDSFGQVELVGFLERSFKVHFTDEELMSPKMASLSGMTELVLAKMA